LQDLGAPARAGARGCNVQPGCGVHGSPR
jgi:hypothetical protein